MVGYDTTPTCISYPYTWANTTTAGVLCDVTTAGTCDITYYDGYAGEANVQDRIIYRKIKATYENNCTNINYWYKPSYTNTGYLCDLYPGTTTASWSSWQASYSQHLPSLSSRMRDIIRSRLAPAIITDRRPVGVPQDHREAAARETLRRVIGSDKFRAFLKHGHVSVRAKSGLVYQIFPGHGITKVYRDGECVERLCVVLSGSFPPTDSLIMRYLLILNDEADFRSHAIKHEVYHKTTRAPEQRSLAEIYKETKLRLVA